MEKLIEAMVDAGFKVYASNRHEINFDNIMAAALAAIKKQGYAVVPIEPTGEMLSAGLLTLETCGVYDQVRDPYKVMIAAASS